MKNKIFIGGLVFAVMLALHTLAYTGDLAVSATEHNFGEVELGSSSTTMITLMNLGGRTLSVDIFFQAVSSPDFSIASAPPAEIAPGDIVDLHVTYAPSTLGEAFARLVIEWSDGESGVEYVDLAGVGVEPSAGVTVEDILDFIDQSVIEGTLEGRGRGRAALARLFVFRKSLKTAGKFIERGRIRAACGLLWVAYRRSDGIRIPPDFVEGVATPELNTMILELRSALGCL